MVSVSVSIFETKDQSLSISLNFWDHFYKVSVSVSKFDTNFKSLSLSIKNWDWVHWVSVSVSTCKNWSRTSLLYFTELCKYDKGFFGEDTNYDNSNNDWMAWDRILLISKSLGSEYLLKICKLYHFGSAQVHQAWFSNILHDESHLSLRVFQKANYKI